jgi:hypothetical protein
MFTPCFQFVLLRIQFLPVGIDDLPIFLGIPIDVGG